MEKQIGVRILKTDYINWRELEFIQQENFKDLSNSDKSALKASIVSDDFIQPFYVWESSDGKIYCLDGRHRRLLLDELESEGYKIPYLLPATFIECLNKQQAAKLVLKFSSAYAKISQQGLKDFITIYDLDWSEIKSQIDLPELSIDRFEQKFDLFGVKDSVNDEDESFGNIESPLLVKKGDLFQLGNHRIICGDFTSTDTREKLLEGEKARIIICDPPYNLPMGFFSSNKNVKDFAMGVGEMSDIEFSAFLAEIMKVSVASSVEGSIHYIFMDFRHTWHMGEAAKNVYGSPIPKQTCVWVKDIMANGSFYRPQQELCFVFHDKRAKALWNNDLLDEGGFYKSEQELCFIFKNGDGAKHLSHLEMQNRIRTNVWRYPSAISTANPDRYEIKNHPTPKPVAMFADAILDTTIEDDIVIDWFVGSGTTIIACEKTKRRCFATEIDPQYVQNIIIRYFYYCKKTNRAFSFKHLNGSLNIEEFLQTNAV